MSKKTTFNLFELRSSILGLAYDNLTKEIIDEEYSKPFQLFLRYIQIDSDDKRKHENFVRYSLLNPEEQEWLSIFINAFLKDKEKNISISEAKEEDILNSMILRVPLLNRQEVFLNEKHIKLYIKNSAYIEKKVKSIVGDIANSLGAVTDMISDSPDPSPN